MNTNTNTKEALAELDRIMRSLHAALEDVQLLRARLGVDSPRQEEPTGMNATDMFGHVGRS